MLKNEIKRILKRFLEISSIGRKFLYGRRIYSKTEYSQTESKSSFIKKYWHHLYVEKYEKNKSLQISALIGKLEITPVKNRNFFYSLDYFKTLKYQKHILDNYTVNYQEIVQSSLKEKYLSMSSYNNNFSKDMMTVIDALKDYYIRLCSMKKITTKYEEAVNAIGSLFERPAQTFFEGIQRILFINQFLWQTGHRLNGFGHLDWILIDLYRNDIEKGYLTVEQARTYVKDFFSILHEHFRFKSNDILGDTGQIIILGGLAEGGIYNCNELTKLFIEVSMELKLPDPKVLLRCSSKMPDELLSLALECISTGIGAPFLSNDDAVIPALISCGYDESDAYNYVTAACWEPLIPDCSCDQCNIDTFNFAIPFIKMFDSVKCDNMTSINEILNTYHEYLACYTKEILSPLSKLQFEEDPLLSLMSHSALERQKDITQGGAKYQNLGLTSVGMGTVVNSILNIQDIVFEQKRYTLQEFNTLRKNNFAQNETLRQFIKRRVPCYGCDDKKVIELTRRIMDMAVTEFKKYKTKSGGIFKLGLSAPSYVAAGKNTEASFDGRRSEEPFSVHISAANPIPTTELLHFAMQLDYTDNRVNGNVIDFIISPDALNKNFTKYLSLLKAGIKGGIYQLQINVVSSSTLIAARDNPDLYPNLIVRVWGFSAYFNDLPDEYKQVLITRALESEKVA